MAMKWGLALAGAWMAAVAPAAFAATISIGPAHPLMDARLAVVADGLAPGARVEISSRTQARDGLWWRSKAIFVADRSGRVDLAAQAPLSGSYAGIDAMGLFWSQAPDADPASGDHGFFDSDPATSPPRPSPSRKSARRSCCLPERTTRSGRPR